MSCAGMTADSSREENRFNVREQQCDWLRKIMAQSGWWNRRVNTHEPMTTRAGDEGEA